MIVIGIFSFLSIVTVISGALVSSVTFDQTLIDAIVKQHNDLRKSVSGASNMQEMVWDPTIATFASNYASGCSFNHNPAISGKYGENLAAGTQNSYDAAIQTSAVNSWWGENVDYTYSSNTCVAGKACGHYTQMAWATSCSFGCGAAVCSELAGWSAGQHILVCDYAPPGNYIGQSPYTSGTACSQCAGGGACTNGLCASQCAVTTTTTAVTTTAAATTTVAGATTTTTAATTTTTGATTTAAATTTTAAGTTTTAAGTTTTAATTTTASGATTTTVSGATTATVAGATTTTVAGATTTVAGATTTAAGATITSSACIDTNALCSFWAGKNECVTNPAYMRNSCQVSCNSCSCLDSNSLCSFWAGQGQCTANPSYMLGQCRVSCSQCGSGSGATTTPAGTAGTGGVSGVNASNFVFRIIKKP